MEKKILVFEHPKFGKVHGYLDENGTAWFNVEDIARGLGFTQVAKSGNVVVRWERVNKYLREFGFIPTNGDDIPTSGDGVTKGDFIPENMFYRLAMKANNETAQDFQAWLADEVVPSIRKTGSYSLPGVQTAVAVQNQQPVLKSAIIANALQNAAIIKQTMEEKFGVKSGISSAVSLSMVEKADGVELSEVKAVLPAAEHEIGRFTPTQIAKKFGLKSAQIVNKLFIEFGLQTKDENGYTLTDAGKNYGEIIPFNNNTNEHSGYQIKWSAAVFSFFEGNGYTLK